MWFPLFPRSLRSPSTCSFHGLLFPEKNDVAESLGLFDIREGSLNSKTCKNKEICFVVLKPNEKGLF
jgi:hypothetical protein